MVRAAPAEGVAPAEGAAPAATATMVVRAEEIVATSTAATVPHAAIGGAAPATVSAGVTIRTTWRGTVWVCARRTTGPCRVASGVGQRVAADLLDARVAAERQRQVEFGEQAAQYVFDPAWPSRASPHT